MSNLNAKEELLYSSLYKFFQEKDKEIKLVINILKGIDRISLRILDWFVTNYSKKHNTTIGSTYVYNSYKSQLKAYSKKYFDPFCRRQKINFHYNSTEFINTTIGQMCFFRWVFTNDVLQYIYANIVDIEADMFVSLSKKLESDEKSESSNSLETTSSSSSSHGRRKKREITSELEESPKKEDIILSFD